MRHVVVHSRPDRFAGWPANNGLWCWAGVEMLVAFSEGAFREQPGHNLVDPCHTRLARSTDQGDTWTLEPLEPFAASGRPGTPRSPIDFSAEGLALRVVGTGYHGSDCPEGAVFHSADRGHSWQGPFALTGLQECPELRGWEITARTDVVVEGPHSGLLMLSARNAGWLSDRTFCARTTDGGRSFRFHSWVVPPADPARGVMPATVDCPGGALLTAIRRRAPQGEICWIDAYRSDDRGRSWTLAARVAQTGAANGNPPALQRLEDGRVCCVFGERNQRRLIARFSEDEASTWGDEQVLRDDFMADRHDDPDLGYPRLTQRADGQLLAVYYWATRELPQQHIAATIWSP